MKQLAIAVITAIFLGAFTSGDAHARRGVSAGVIYQSGDEIEIVQEIPDNIVSDLGLPTGADLAWKHYHFEIFWIPFYASSDGRYVLSDGGKSYYPLTDMQIAMIGYSIGEDLSQPHKGGIVTHYWGWLLIFGGILFSKGSKLLSAQFSPANNPRSHYSRIF